jgi:predicted Zn-dependent protease
MFLIEKGEQAYLVSVVHMEKGTGPKKPDNKYFQNLMKNYTEGSKTTLRSSKPATIAGRPGIDGISDAGDSAHQVQIMASGDRVYMVIFVGPKGQENGPDATRFRQSFKLLK